MTNVIVEAVKAGIAAAGALPWQVQLGMAAGGVLIGIIGGVVGWFGHKIKSNPEPKGKLREADGHRKK